MTTSSRPLSTARLDLEPLAVGHAQEMVSVLADPALYAVTGGEPPTLQQLVSRYHDQVRGVSPDGSEQWLNWIVRERRSGAAVGYVQATVLTTPTGSTADLAWVVGTPWQGHGYAAEAAAELLSWLTGAGVVGVRACIAEGHIASEKVAIALGMEPTAERVDGEVVWRRPGPDLG